ncbi:MAG: biotin--[acetyl-CoA-carboxylase] ligase [Chitinispirillaceae bacterium]|nr:biotin--[acetyl-CoA-carboxylase] ligase [Chitinispirillaceae bacterium]
MIPHVLSGLSFIERFYSYPTLPSTNETAKAFRHRPAKGFYCIQADRQTAGRGRRGASFFSDTPGGLWVSLVTALTDTADHFSYNRAVSLAITLTIAQCGTDLPIAIKWPNDIYWGKKKICGILLENHPLFEDLLIIGFGINVNIRQDEFPPQLRSLATSILIETGRKCSLGALLRTVLKQYMVVLAADKQKVHALYSNRLYGRGTKITINGMTGTFSSVEPDGQLKLVTGGTTVLVNSGSPVFL